MSTKVIYEWKLETIDERDPVDGEHSDIVDCDFSPALFELYPPGPHQRICLVRDVLEERDIGERDHAYIVNGRLATETEEYGHKVPVRFHKELARLL